MKFLMRPLTKLYRWELQRQQQRYFKGSSKQVRLSVPVISVGNLTMGGTGKTPIVAWLLRLLQKKSLKIAVVSRAYKAKATVPCCVDITQEYAADMYGDEAVLLAKMFPEVDFYSGQSKAEIAEYASTQGAYDVILVDDGFQHWALYRDLDFVILDATESFENYRLIPEGRAREDFSALARAGVIVVTKTNLVSAESLNKLRQMLPPDKPQLFFESVIHRLELIEGTHTSEIQWADLRKEAGLYATAGIAKPLVFQKMLESEGLSLTGTRWFSDHHPYSAQDMSELSQWVGDGFLICTAKDFVKMKPFMREGSKVVVAHLDFRTKDSLGGLDEIFTQLHL